MHRAVISLFALLAACTCLIPSASAMECEPPDVSPSFWHWDAMERMPLLDAPRIGILLRYVVVASESSSKAGAILRIETDRVFAPVATLRMLRDSDGKTGEFPGYDDFVVASAKCPAVEGALRSVAAMDFAPRFTAADFVEECLPNRPCRARTACIDDRYLLDVFGDPQISKRWMAGSDAAASAWVHATVAAIRACPGVVVAGTEKPRPSGIVQ